MWFKIRVCALLFAGCFLVWSAIFGPLLWFRTYSYYALAFGGFAGLLLASIVTIYVWFRS